MALKALITKVEHATLPEAIREHYKAEGDSFVLDTDADPSKAKLAEFRQTNIDLMKKQEQLVKDMKKFDGIDPTKVKEAELRLQEMEDQALIDEGKNDELLEKRTERMKDDFDNRYKALEEANADLIARASNSEGQLHTKMVEAKIAQAVNGVGTVLKGAMPDILARAKQVWKLDDDLNLVAMKEEQPIFGTDGKTNLTTEEYATSLLQEAPFFFEGNSGGGGAGNENDNKTPGGVVNAGDKAAFGSNLEDIASGKVQAQL